MSKAFSQYEFEREVYRALENGDMTYLADANGSSPAYYSQMMNPEDDRRSILFRAAQDIALLMERDAERGCTVLATFNHFAKRGLAGSGKVCLEAARKDAYRESTEFQLAEAENKPLTDKIKELEDSINAKTELLDGYRAELRKEIAADAFRGLEADGNIRNFGKRVAAGARR